MRPTCLLRKSLRKHYVHMWTWLTLIGRSCSLRHALNSINPIISQGSTEKSMCRVNHARNIASNKKFLVCPIGKVCWSLRVDMKQTWCRLCISKSVSWRNDLLFGISPRKFCTLTFKAIGLKHLVCWKMTFVSSKRIWKHKQYVHENHLC